MDEKQIQKKISEILRKDIEQASLAAFLGTTTTAATEPTALSYESLMEAVSKLPPILPALPFDQIKVSEAGWQKMKEEMGIEEKRDAFDDIYCAGIQILIRNYMPDNMAIGHKRPVKETDVISSFYIINLG